MLPEAVVALVQRFEGLHKVRSDGLVYPYLCSAGVPTIGWGSTRLLDGSSVTLATSPITPEEAYGLLMVELEACTSAALRMSPVLAGHPARLSAIISFIYNLGPGNYRASTLKKRVDAQDWIGAGREIRRWVLVPFESEGLFLGMRTIKNGTVCSSYEGATFTPTEHFRVALVSPGEKLNPVYAPVPEKA